MNAPAPVDKVEIREIVDPRRGDAEDDASSTVQRSLFAIAGSLLVEISLPKLFFAFFISLVLPALLLGVTPLVATAWLSTVSEQVRQLTEIGTLLALGVAVLLGWLGWRSLFRIAETNFWSLNALVVQPGYTFCREALRHLAEKTFGRGSSVTGSAHLRSISSVGAALIVCGWAILIAYLVWPATRWLGVMGDLLSPLHLVRPILANATFVVSGYLAVASLVWGFADASMDQPADLPGFDTAPAGARAWRVVHLSDIHIVGERYGFRIESGRAGPRGNDRLAAVMARLATIHSTAPLDVILISGDMTDAGRATEWAELLDLVAQYPALAERMIVLPGNHDLNIVDRANPARLDLPFSPSKRLRQMRVLSAMAAIQGDRVQVIGADTDSPTQTLNQALAPLRQDIASFADLGGLRRSARLERTFDNQFPMILAPDTADGLGVVVLNSNAQTHFSFTNALGLISLEQARGLEKAIKRYPAARWIVALHHHLVEYPMPVAVFSERVGTALVNGSWFVRTLRPFGRRLVVMHGHRHIDWIGACGDVKIISAPSPVMDARDEATTHFYIHNLAAGPDGGLCLLAPERIEIAGVTPG
jgi:3',5'-cyclic AMP phosphodiesterase CpdA